MTADVLEISVKPTRRKPKGERMATPEAYRQATKRIRPCGVELRFSEGLKAEEREHG